MDFEKSFCGFPGNGESLQTEDDFVWVEQETPISSFISPDEQRRSEGISSECTDVSPTGQYEQGSYTDNILMSDFIEDVSNYDDMDQYYSTVEILGSYKKKSTNKQKPALKRITPSRTINRPQNEQPFNIDMFDEPTAKILKSFVSSNNYYNGNFGNIISKTHNSIVAHAYISKKAYATWEPGAKPILVYATINNEYNKRYRNWKSEENAVKIYKLFDDETKNEIIFKQVQKEKEHLCLLKKAKCNVPEVRRCTRNIIVMSLVGDNGVTAPTIDTLNTNIIKRCTEMYNIIIKHIEMWYKTLHLIHGQLSCENILFWNKEFHYIGWSHSVRSEHPQALKKLMKDCRFITKFFETRGVPVIPAEKLFKDITGLNEVDESLLSIINSKQSKDLWKGQHLTNPNRMTSGHSFSPGRSCWFKR